MTAAPGGAAPGGSGAGATDPTITANTLAKYVPALRDCGNEFRLRLLLHDFAMVWQHAGAEQRKVLVADEPERFDPRWDAFLAALVEHLCYHAGLAPPGWVFAEDRHLRRFWHPGGVFDFERGTAMLTTPAAFEVHGIWLPERELHTV